MSFQPSNRKKNFGGNAKQQMRLVSTPAPAEGSKTGIKEIKDVLLKRLDAIQSVLPSGSELNASTLANNALSYLMAEQHRTLRMCTPYSIFKCTMAAAKLGLDFVGDQCYMAPYEKRDKDGNHLYWYASFLPGYQGLIAIAGRNGFHINAQVVYEKELEGFQIDLGELWIRHRPLLSPDRGQIVGAYAAAMRSSDLRIVFIDFMQKDQIDAVRGDSEAWEHHYDEMARSRPIRRVYKYLAKTTQQMALAQEFSNRYDTEQPIDDLLGLENQE